MTAAAPLRIAIVAPYDLSMPGGINNQIRAQASGLRRLGHSVGVFGPASAPLSGGERSLGGTVSVSFGGTESGLGVDPRAFSRITRMVRDRYDVIHVHEPLTPLVPWIVLLQSRAPLVGTFHVYRENGHRFYASFGSILRPLARRLRARIAVSDAAKRTVEPHIPGDYEIVPNGIDVGRFAAPRHKPAAFAADRHHLLYVGRLEPRKGVETLVRAMPTVQQHASVRLIVAGDGPQRTMLEQLARSLQADVHFAGRVADEELPAYYQAADIVCSPALGGESFGVVLLEAMASGKPIVASRIDGYEALVGTIGCARLVAPGDAHALARELEWLLESSTRRHELGSRGAAAARDFDDDAIARRLEGIYRRIQPNAGGFTDRTR